MLSNYFYTYMYLLFALHFDPQMENREEAVKVVKVNLFSI